MRDDERELTLHISSTSIIRAIIIVGLFAALWFLRDIILVVLTAVVIASAIEPATRWMVAHKIPRVPSTIMLYTVIGGVIVSIFYFFLPALWSDFVQIGKVVPKSFQLDLWNPLQESNASPSVGDAINKIFPNSTAGNVLDYAQGAIGSGDIASTFNIFFGGILSFVLIVVLSFYFSAQEKGIETFLKLVSPKRKQNYVVDLWRRSQEKIGLWFQGQLLLGVLIGVLVFMGLTILGVPNALFLALIAAVFELIPIFGPILAAVPAVIIAFTNGLSFAPPGISAGVAVALFYFIIQQFENHLIFPLVVRKVTGVHPIVSILALIIGAKTAGFLGILLSVPLAAVLVEYIMDVAKSKDIVDA